MLTDAELAAMRERCESGMLWCSDMRRLLDEVARLRAENASLTRQVGFLRQLPGLDS